MIEERPQTGPGKGRDVETGRFRRDDGLHSRLGATQGEVEQRQGVDTGQAKRLLPKRRNNQKHVPGAKNNGYRHKPCRL